MINWPGTFLLILLIVGIYLLDRKKWRAVAKEEKRIREQVKQLEDSDIKNFTLQFSHTTTVLVNRYFSVPCVVYEFMWNNKKYLVTIPQREVLRKNIFPLEMTFSKERLLEFQGYINF